MFGITGKGARIVAATIAIGATGASPALADPAAEAFVSGVLDEANVIFEGADRAVRDPQIEALVDKYVDMDRVAKFALGQYARQASDEQMAAYLPLFRDYATGVYQTTLDSYSGQKLKVTGSVDRGPRDFVVDSKIIGAQPGDQYADVIVHWRIYRRPDGSQAVVDAGAEGVWLAIEQQSQFKSVIANNGGGAKGIDALIADLKTKAGS